MPADRDLAACDVDRDRAEPEDAGRIGRRAAGAAEQRRHPGAKLGQPERLRHVVVGAGLERGRPCRARRRGRVRTRIGVVASRRTRRMTVEPVVVGQAEVEQDQVRAARLPASEARSRHRPPRRRGSRGLRGSRRRTAGSRRRPRRSGSRAPVASVTPTLVGSAEPAPRAASRMTASPPSSAASGRRGPAHRFGHAAHDREPDAHPVAGAPPGRPRRAGSARRSGRGRRSGRPGRRPRSYEPDAAGPVG